MSILTYLAVALAFVGAVVSWSFVHVYARPPFHWRTYEAGRHLMRFTLGIAIILTWTLVVWVLLLIVGRESWLLMVIDVGRVVIFGWLALMVASRLHLLLKARRDPVGDDNAANTAART